MGETSTTTDLAKMRTTLLMTGTTFWARLATRNTCGGWIRSRTPTWGNWKGASGVKDRTGSRAQMWARRRDGGGETVRETRPWRSCRSRFRTSKIPSTIPKTPATKKPRGSSTRPGKSWKAGSKGLGPTSRMWTSGLWGMSVRRTMWWKLRGKNPRSSSGCARVRGSWRRSGSCRTRRSCWSRSCRSKGLSGRWSTRLGGRRWNIGSRVLNYNSFRSSAKRIWFRCLRTPICANFMLNGWRLCPGTCSCREGSGGRGLDFVGLVFLLFMCS